MLRLGESAGIMPEIPPDRAKVLSDWTANIRAMEAKAEAAWNVATAGANAAGAGARAWEWIKANRTAVYITAAGLFALALLRRRN